MNRVVESNIQYGSVLCSEGRLWLEMIHRKVAGCLKVRNPYFKECKRSVPIDVFIVFNSVNKGSSELHVKELKCHIAKIRKGAIISQRSVVMLFNILVLFGDAKVNKYFFLVL